MTTYIFVCKMYIYIYIYIYIYVRDVEKYMKPLWKVENIYMCAYTYTHLHLHFTYTCGYTQIHVHVHVRLRVRVRGRREGGEGRWCGWWVWVGEYVLLACVVCCVVCLSGCVLCVVSLKIKWSSTASSGKAN